MAVYFITGCARGIGFATVKEIVADSKNVVIGTYRTKSSEFTEFADAHSNLHLIQLDTTEALESMKEKLTVIDSISETGVDIIIQNSGVLLVPNPDYTIDVEDLVKTHEINFIGSAKIYMAIEKYWLKHDNGVKKQFLFVSSYLGSMAAPFPLKPISYGSSKAAVNYLVVGLDQKAKASSNPLFKNASIVALHPGLVRSDMGNRLLKRVSLPSISPEESAQSILKLSFDPRPEYEGKLVNYDGTIIAF